MMLGLGEYESSSEDEVEHKHPSPKPQRKKDLPLTNSQTGHNEVLKTVTELPNEPLSNPAINVVPNGPVLGPASMEMAPLPEDRHPSSGRTSPFSATRALIQDLTLPPVPNLDIPASPPGSPNPAANAKFEHFLSLKKQGIHFNSKLASSSSLKNPSLLMKMMEHAGIDENSQYNTSLPADLWTTSNLPSWGFKEELLRTQQILRKQSEDKNSSGQRTSIGFVPGSA